MSQQLIRVGHSPDPDDAFMFYALSHDRIDTGRYRFEHELTDIQTLNERAFTGVLEVSAISLHTYAHVADRYAIMHCGVSMGKGYGPIVVTREPVAWQELSGRRIAVPGLLTTAYMTLRLYLPDFEPLVTPFDQILECVSSGEADAGLVIHEGQLTYPDLGLHCAVDLGEEWLKDTDLPLPLGVNVIRRDLGEKVMSEVVALIRQSIDYALGHREEALEYALEWGRGLDTERADRFVSMYVNDYTRDFGEEGERAVEALLSRAHECGVIEHKPEIAFVR